MAAVADEKAWLGDDPGGGLEPNHPGQHAGKTFAWLHIDHHCPSFT